MEKLPHVLCLIALATLGFGTYLLPNEPVFWMATNSETYHFIRIGLAAILVAQLATKPPRQQWFRVMSGAAVALMGLWGITEIYAFQMMLLDMAVLTGTGLVVLASALETTKIIDTIPEPFKVRVHHVTVRKITV